MSKKDRVLLMILTTMMINTNSLSLPAFAQDGNSVGGGSGSSMAQSDTASDLSQSADDAAVDNTAQQPLVSVSQEEQVSQEIQADVTAKDSTQIAQHHWGSWKTTKGSTVTVAGTRQRTCSVCGETQTQTLAKTSIRLSGNNRYDTAFEIAKQLKAENGGKNFERIVIACGTSFPDALSASYLAKVANAPILIHGKAVEAQLIDFIKKNSSSSVKIYIIGGSGAIDESFEKKLKNTFKAKDQIKRLWGQNRFTTNYEVLKEASKFEKTSSGILVASGMNYADALSASAVGLPILLVAGSKLTDEQKAYLGSHKNKAVTIIGGNGAVSEDIQKQLRSYTSKIDRLSGKNRYETSYLVANKFFSKPDTIVLTYALNFPDGLCGGPLAIRYGAPLLLVANTSTELANKYAAAPCGNEKNMVTSTVTLGGTALISDDALKLIVTDEMKESSAKIETTAAGSITKHPANVSVKPGETAKFTVAAKGNDLSYQWQSSVDGVAWINIEGKTSPSFSFKTESLHNANLYRCVVTSACGISTPSNAAKLSVHSLSIISQPESFSGGVDSSASFNIKTNKEGLEYQWQYSDDNGKTWKNTSVRSPAYSVKITSANNGRLVRCRITDPSTGESLNSSSAKLSANKKFGITKQPTQASGDLNSVQYLTVQAGGEGLKFKWQESTDGKTGWKNITNDPSASTSRLSRSITPTNCGRSYRCIITDKNGKSVTSEPARIVSEQTGFVELDGKKICILSNGSTARGLQKIGSDTFCFSDTGEMLTGLRRINNSLYSFDDQSGKMLKGIQKLNDSVYFFGSDGKAVSGWHTASNGDKYYFAPKTNAALKGINTINGKKYFFNSDGKKATGLVRDTNGKYLYISDTAVKSGFITINGATFYLDKNGYAVTGLQKIDGSTYYFGKNGAMLTGGYLISGKRYFFDVRTGKAVIGIKERENSKKYCYNGANGVWTGLKKVGDKLYLFNDKGEMIYGYRSIDDKWYYFDRSTGEAISGWRENIGSYGNSYIRYFSPTTHAAVTGLQKIDGVYYYFNESGARLGGVREVNSKHLLFDQTTGRLQTGWYVSASGYTYYYDGINGRISGSKCARIGGKYYFFNDYGVLCSGIRTTADGKKLYFDPTDYSLVTGFVNYNGKVYYSDGLNGLKTGNVTIGENEYMFSETGYIRRTGLQTIGDKTLWFDENTGIRTTGFQYSAVNDRYYLFEKNSRASGFKYYGSVLYRFSDYGIPGKGAFSQDSNPYGFRVYFDDQTGEQQLGLISYTASSGNTYTFYYLQRDCITAGAEIDTIKQKLERAKTASGWQKVEGLDYYVQNGDFVKGLKKIDGKTYYFSSMTGAKLTSLRRIGSDYYWFSTSDGSMLTGWQTIEGKKFYFDTTSGKMLTGLQTISGKTYCLLQGGGYATGTVMIGEDTYTFASDGTGTKKTASKGKMPSPNAKADSWETINGVKYYHDHSGALLKGLQIIDKKMYLFDTSTGAMRKGVITYGGATRCYTDDGVLLGLQTVNSKLYYFEEAGAALKNKVMVINDKTYYFTKDGSAATGFCYVPEYLCTYYFDKDHTAHTGWLELNGKKYYYYPQADFYVPGTPAHGITYVNGGKTAYFDYETAEQKTGLIKVGLNRYMYFDPKTGYAVSGLKTINGAMYLFSDDKESFGVSLNEMQTVGKDTYYFDPTTQKAVTGFVTINYNTYYFDKNYKRVSGLQTIDNSTYFFNEKWGTMKTGLSLVGGKLYFFADNGKAISGWYTNDSGDRYYFSPKDHTACTGLQTIDGKKYYFASNGIMRTGLIRDDSGKYHYFVTEGKATGFIQAKGNTYYVNADGSVRTGISTISGATYYFGTTGPMYTGAHTVNDKRYYFDPDTGKAVTGFVKRENGYTYYYDGANGVKTGLQVIGGKTYLLNENGIVQTGRRLVGNKYYFFDLYTCEAVSGWRESISSTGAVFRAYYMPDTLTAAKGLKKIDGAYYYFSDYGIAQCQTRKVNGVNMYFDPVTFKLYTGMVRINGKVYYSNGLKGRTLSKDGKTPLRACSWGTIGGSKYYYGSNGKPVTGLQIIDGKMYLFDDSGKLLTGLVKYNGVTRYYTDKGILTGLQKINNVQYYFSPVDGSMLTGLKDISGKKYFFDDTGKSCEGWFTTDGSNRCYITHTKGLYTGLQTIDGKQYWFGTSGIMRTGVITVTDNKGSSRICLFGDDGAMVHGLVERYGNYYYYDDVTGTRVTGWKKVGTKQYYFDETSGAAYTGKRSINNYYYYFDPETAQRQTGIVKVGKYFYNFTDKTKDGLTYGMTKINGELYYFDETTGASRLGFVILDDVYYYFSEQTGSSVEGIQWITKDTAYYFEKNGGVKKGLVTFEGKQYYLYPSNGKVSTGLISIGDKLYYFGKDGAMLKNTTVKVSGISYTIDDNGFVSVNGNSKLEKMIRSGIDKLGLPYHEENEALDDPIDPSIGYNCSEFVTKLLSDIDIMVPNIAYRQQHILTHSGDYEFEYVQSTDQLKPGDIIYLSSLKCNTTDNCAYFNHIHHTMIYVDNNTMMHSTATEMAERRCVNVGTFKDSEVWFAYKIIRLKEIK